MALGKEIEINNTGITGNYIKVSTIKLNVEIGEIMIDLEIYASKEAREKGKNPISNATIRKPINETITDFREAAYNEVKSLPEFEGSEDV